MITEGGMYVLQLVDNHSATYSALILGCSEVSIMAWIYGADRFLEDMKFMLGFYPYPRFFWKWAWKITFSSVILIPIVATIKIYNEEGTFSYRIQKLTQPTYEWGPASPQHRRLPTTSDSRLGGYTGPSQGSNITL